jgi:hypothetical protein
MSSFFRHKKVAVADKWSLFRSKIRHFEEKIAYVIVVLLLQGGRSNEDWLNIRQNLAQNTALPWQQQQHQYRQMTFDCLNWAQSYKTSLGA